MKDIHRFSHAGIRHLSLAAWLGCSPWLVPCSPCFNNLSSWPWWDPWMETPYGWDISVDGIYFQSCIYTRLTLTLPSGERGSAGAEHDGILPTPLPALPQPPPPAHQGRAGRRSQDLCQDQRQQVWGLRLDPEWQVKFENSGAARLLCRGCRIEEEWHLNKFRHPQRAPHSHFYIHWQTFVVKYDYTPLWHSISHSPILHTVRNMTQTHACRHTWKRKQTTGGQNSDGLLKSPQMFHLWLIIHLTLTSTSLDYKASKKKMLQRRDEQDTHLRFSFKKKKKKEDLV